MRLRFNSLLPIVLLSLAFLVAPSGAAAQSGTPDARTDDAEQHSYNHLGLLESGREQATSQLQLDVLADGYVTPQENEDVRNEFMTCVHDAGYAYEFESGPYQDGGGEYVLEADMATPGSEPDDEHRKEQAEAITKCMESHMGLVSVIRESQLETLTNPARAELFIGCMESTGTVETGALKIDDIRADAATNPEPTVIDESDPQTQSCMLDPTQAGIDFSAPTDATPAATPSS